MTTSNRWSSELIERLSRATHVTVFTGAGVSAESGISTFRDAGGIWARFKPEELASIEAFLQNPLLVQEWYSERKRVAHEAQPNPGHVALAELERDLKARGKEFALVTQNVDDLHRRAGSENVIELHGNITRSYCYECNRPAEEEDLQNIETGSLAVCPACNGMIRPDVVWFGEQLPYQAVEDAVNAAQRTSIMLSVGTSSVVYPAAQIPLMAREHGAYVAEINVERSDIASALNEVITGKSGEILPALLEAYKKAVSSTDHTIHRN